MAVLCDVRLALELLQEALFFLFLCLFLLILREHLVVRIYDEAALVAIDDSHVALYIILGKINAYQRWDIHRSRKDCRV